MVGAPTKPRHASRSKVKFGQPAVQPAVQPINPFVQLVPAAAPRLKFSAASTWKLQQEEIQRTAVGDAGATWLLPVEVSLEACVCLQLCVHLCVRMQK